MLSGMNEKEQGSANITFASRRREAQAQHAFFQRSKLIDLV